jgi:hypothetical protein
MKIRRLRRRFSAEAPRLAIRPHLPWYVVWCSAVGGAIYHHGRAFAVDARDAAESRQKALATQNVRLETANSALKSQLAAIERQLQIERATHADLGKQVKVLSSENSRLREDIALLRAISASGSKSDGISVSSARVQADLVPGEYTYRIVLVQTGSRTKPFRGTYQLLVNMVQDGRRVGIRIPEAVEKAPSAYKLDFRLHQRIDGTFKVAPGAEVQSVQVRVFEGGQPQPKVMQTVAIS